MIRFLIIFAMFVDSELVAAQSFRSILIERACSKRPDLDFCSESSSTVASPSSSTSSTVFPLVLPPHPSTIPTVVESVHSSTAPTTSATPESDSVEFEELEKSNNVTNVASNSTSEHERLGSLVRLPKPAKSSHETVVDNVLKAGGVSADDKSEGSTNSNGTSVSIEDEKGVLVFVSEYCVIEREHFVKSCNGEIDSKEIAFCKTYPSACVSTNGVIPVISYCQRYYKHYPKHCTKQLVAQGALQFCFAFEQFCLPELHAAVQRTETPKSSLRKCEDVLPEARKVCNPFPNPKDTFNLLRCTHFLTNCKKFVDWL